MAKRDGIFSWISLDKLRNIYTAIIGVENILRYSEDFTFENDNDLITKSYVDNFSINTDLATNVNLTDDGGGGQYLPFTLIENGFPVGVNVKRTDTNEVQFVGFGNYVPFVGFNAMPWDNTIPQEMIIYSYGGGIIPEPTLPVITVQPTASATIFRGFTLTTSITATNAVSYQWYKDGVLMVGQTTQVLTISDFDATKNGSYTCKATNTNGTVESDACVASLKKPVSGEIIFINVSDLDTSFEDNFAPPQVVGTGSYSDKNPMINNQWFKANYPYLTTLEYRRFNADGTLNGSPLVLDAIVGGSSLNASTMTNTLGYEFYIRNT